MCLEGWFREVKEFKEIKEFKEGKEFKEDKEFKNPSIGRGVQRAMSVFALDVQGSWCNFVP